jgi:hypothetical protein
MLRVKNKGREHQKEPNKMTKDYFTLPGDAACTAQSAWCLLCGGM